MNEISVVCSAQSGKTLTLICLVCWMLANDPGSCLWLTANKDEAKKVSIGRLGPAINLCGPLKGKIPEGREKKGTYAIWFPGAPLLICGAGGVASLQSFPYRIIILDEARQYKEKLGMVQKRTRSKTNYKQVMITTPDNVGDEVDIMWREGTQEVFELKCPECGHFHELTWGEKNVPGGVKWETSDETKPNGRWDFQKLEKTIRYQCYNPSCGHLWEPTVRNRKEMQRNGRWTANNPTAPKNKISITWGALLPWWTKPEENLREYLRAVEALKYGNPALYKTFVTETLGKPWDPKMARAKGDGYIEKRKALYNPREPFPMILNGITYNEVRRICTVDVQGKGGRHYYYVIRAWANGGASRQLAFGKVWSISDVRQACLDWNVSAQNVGIDTGTFTDEVYGHILDSGYMPNGLPNWKAMKGDKALKYNIDGIWHPFQDTFVDPYIGDHAGRSGRNLKIWQILFSKATILDRMENFMRGNGPPWEILTEASATNPGGLDYAIIEEYCRQATAYERREREDSFGRITNDYHQVYKDDHYGSCERMQMVMAMRAGIVHSAISAASMSRTDKMST